MVLKVVGALDANFVYNYCRTIIYVSTLDGAAEVEDLFTTRFFAGIRARTLD